MRMPLSILMLALLGWGGLAAAEGGCPPGQYPYETPQARQCVPIPGGSSGASQSSAVYQDRWGAIAVDGAVSVGGIGTSEDMPSKRKAEKAAIARCRATGGGNGCVVDLSYHNQCAVIGSGDSYMQSFAGPDIESTSQRALEACNRKTTNCTIYYSGCSYPQRVQ
jgi:hypothetical protein